MKPRITSGAAVSLAVLLSSALAAALPTPEPSSSSSTSCDAYAAGLTAWSDADFAGSSHQYNVSWNTCVSMAGQFPYEAAAGVSSIAAHAYNWCTVYPNVHCDAGQGRANDTLDVVGSYYDLAGPEEAWDNLPQSFSCRPYNC